MLIRIRYRDGRYDMVKPFILDRLIAERSIEGFHRSEGWVTIGRDRIRGDGGEYHGPERRVNHYTMKGGRDNVA
jgi:hypothetical protein